LSREEYEKLIDDVIDVASEVDFFRGVPYRELFLILKDFDRHILKRGEHLFSKGWENGRVCLVLSGSVGIYTEEKVIHMPQGIDIKTPPVSILKRGDTIGQIGAMSPLKRPFLVKVTSDEADIVSFHIDFQKEKECLRGFLALYKNAFYRLGKGIITIANEAKLRRRETDHAIESYLANLH